MMSRACTGDCSFETLGADILLAILCALHSPDALAALIRASPASYRRFSSAKSLILARLVTNQLGPAVHDAVLLTETTRFSGENHEAEVDAKVCDYSERLQAIGPPAGLDEQAAVHLVKVSRTIFYFADLYARLRMEYFQKHLRPPPHLEPLSWVERQRIAQALVRYQLLVHMHGGRFWEPLDYGSFLARVFSLFDSWELEQVSQMDHFIGSLCGALVRITREPPHKFVDHQSAFDRYYPDLEAFRARWQEAEQLDPALWERVGSDISMSSGVIDGAFSMFGWLKASHRHGTPQLLPNVTRPYRTIRSSCEAACNPPWAWEDGLLGRQTTRWGLDLIWPPDGNAVPRTDYKRVCRVLQSWRFLGLVFWDRPRAEQLKRTTALASCTTGWLIPWQDAIY
ncbi:hypothetical protein S40293_11525 [Stachybotrys chartarum IBT 40293]|nr:hypothetical protein S40293_11525 [Stachybotrys chartarum IBT 40293]